MSNSNHMLTFSESIWTKIWLRGQKKEPNLFHGASEISDTKMRWKKLSFKDLKNLSRFDIWHFGERRKARR
ncbi:Fatty Acid Synthase [Manis pentadactyla]|nr:Fatty Acid Synthase [Manis pentadactyla]